MFTFKLLYNSDRILPQNYRFTGGLPSAKTGYPRSSEVFIKIEYNNVFKHFLFITPHYPLALPFSISAEIMSMSKLKDKCTLCWVIAAGHYEDIEC